MSWRTSNYIESTIYKVTRELSRSLELELMVIGFGFFTLNQMALTLHYVLLGAIPLAYPMLSCLIFYTIMYQLFTLKSTMEDKKTHIKVQSNGKNTVEFKGMIHSQRFKDYGVLNASYNFQPLTWQMKGPVVSYSQKNRLDDDWIQI